LALQMSQSKRTDKPPGFPIKKPGKPILIKKPNQFPSKTPINIKNVNSPRLASNVAKQSPRPSNPPATPPNPNSWAAKIKKANQACVWVGFGSSIIEEKTLRQQFTKHGYTSQIMSITCQENPNGNYAFINVESLPVAKDIISKLNGLPINGITLQMRLRTASDSKKPVKKSPPKELPPEESGDHFTKVWVGFGQDKNEQKTKDIANELQILFSRVGEIKKFETCSNRKGNVAFITYESSLHARKAINTYDGRILKGHKIVVRKGNSSTDEHESTDKSRQLQDQVVTLQEKNQDMKMRVQYLNHQKEKQIKEVRLLRDEKNSMQDENESLLAKIQDFNALQQCQKDRISDLQAQLIDAIQKTSELTNENQAMKDEKRLLEERNQRLQRDYDSLQSKMNHERHGHNQNKGKRRPKNNYKGRDKSKGKQRDNNDNSATPSPQQHNKQNAKSSRGRKKHNKSRGRGLFQNAVDQAHASTTDEPGSRSNRGRGRGRGRGRNNYKKNSKKADLENLPTLPEVKRQEAHV